jgi:hypothetical protein
MAAFQRASSAKSLPTFDSQRPRSAGLHRSKSRNGSHLQKGGSPKYRNAFTAQEHRQSQKNNGWTSSPTPSSPTQRELAPTGRSRPSYRKPTSNKREGSFFKGGAGDSMTLLDFSQGTQIHHRNRRRHHHHHNHNRYHSLSVPSAYTVSRLLFHVA